MPISTVLLDCYVSLLVHQEPLMSNYDIDCRLLGPPISRGFGSSLYGIPTN